MARPPSSEIVRFGLAMPPLPELLVPGAKTSTARPPPGKDAETKSWPLLSNLGGHLKPGHVWPLEMRPKAAV